MMQSPHAPAIGRDVTAIGLAQLIVEGAEIAVTKLARVLLCGAECESLLEEAWSPLAQLYAFTGCAMLRRMTSPRLLSRYSEFLGDVYDLVLLEVEERAASRFGPRTDRAAFQARDVLGRYDTLLDELTAFLVEYARFRPLGGGERYAGTFGYETGKRAALILGRPDDIGIIGVAASAAYGALRLDDVSALMQAVYLPARAPAIAS